MDSLRVDHAYGRALFEVSLDRGITNKISEEYIFVSRTFAAYPELRKLFLVPTISVTEKRIVAKKVFGRQITKELLNFLYILIDKRRVGAWEDIQRYYEHLIWESAGLINGVIYSVIPIDRDKLESFEEKTSAELGKRVVLDNRIDGSLIGGTKIYADGKIIDSSVKTRLETLKQRIMQ